MAYCDYRHCDVCDCKVFYDAEVNYEDSRLGEWSVICDDCAKSHKVAVVPKAPRPDFLPLADYVAECGELVEGEYLVIADVSDLGDEHAMPVNLLVCWSGDRWIAEYGGAPLPASCITHVHRMGPIRVPE